MPLSMAFVAILLRPWLVHMKELSAKPRALADDILLITTGPNARDTFNIAFNATLVHLQDMGARISSDKSNFFLWTPTL